MKNKKRHLLLNCYYFLRPPVPIWDEYSTPHLFSCNGSLSVCEILKVRLLDEGKTPPQLSGALLERTANLAVGSTLCHAVSPGSKLKSFCLGRDFLTRDCEDEGAKNAC